MKNAEDVLDSMQNNIFCEYTFNRGLRDFAILKPILTENEINALTWLLVETDYNNPDIDTIIRMYRCEEISWIIKALKMKYKGVKVSTENIPKEYDKYWCSNGSFNEALDFAYTCRQMIEGGFNYGI